MSKRGLPAPKITPLISFCIMARSNRLTLAVQLHLRGDPGDHTGTALAGQGQGAGHQVPVHHARDHDHRVGHLAPGQLGDQGQGLLHGRRRVGGAEVEGRLLLELHGVHGHDVRRPDHPGPLHGVHADAAHADHHHGVAGHAPRPGTRPSPSRWPPRTTPGPPTPSGRSASTLTSDASWLTPCSANVPELGHDVERLAVEVVADGAVGDLAPGEGGGTQVAEVGVAGDAHRAPTADGEEAGGHVVAGLEPGRRPGPPRGPPHPPRGRRPWGRAPPAAAGRYPPPSPSRSTGGARRSGTVRPPPT